MKAMLEIRSTGLNSEDYLKMTKEQLREQLRVDTAAYIAKGGKVSVYHENGRLIATKRK